MRTGALLSVALLALPALVGCIGTDEEAEKTGTDVPAETMDHMAHVRGLLEGVSCEVDQVPMDATSDNLVEVGKLGFNVEEEGIRAELDIRGSLGLVAAYGRGGFDIIDLSDPTAPALVSSYLSDYGALDVKFTPDGTGALVGDGAGVEVVDIRDPVNPVGESFWEFPGSGFSQNAHMLYAAHIAEKDWVFVAPNADRGVDILTLDGAPGARTLTYVTSWAPLDLLKGGPLGPHDMWVGLDETLQAPVLYVANGFEGWAAADVSDPSKPELLGFTINQDLHQGYTHTIQATTIDGRRIVATMEEVGANSVKVYDATNLMAPVVLASWVYDHTHPTYPEHNLQILDGKLYVAHYTQGMFVFDLTALPSAPLSGPYQMEPMAHFAGPGTPPIPEPSPGGIINSFIPFSNVWDVVIDDGIVYTSDTELGVTALGFACLTPGDPLLSTTG